jgi:DNA polymerase-1
MRHHIFEEAGKYKVALLFKASAFNKQEILTNYVSSLNQQGVTSQEVIAFTLQYDDNGKAPVKFIKNYLDNLLPALDSIGVQHLYVADAAYFKVLAGQSKAETHFGYSFTCKIKGFEHMTVVLGINYQALIFNPALETKLDKSVQTLADVVTGNYMPPGHNIIQGASYPSTLEGIAKALKDLHQYPELSCDIEGFSLRFNEAGIGTIAFAWDEHNGVAFACDYYASPRNMNYDPDWPGSNIPNHDVRHLLKTFFTSYKGKLTWHSASYDLKAIIYALWMEGMLDTEGLLKGLEIMADQFDDTKIIAYLATNSTAGNVLGLKSLAHEFAGNWAKDDIKDIRKIPLDELLKYNLVDCLSTWYVKNKFTPIMVEDNQETLYKELMLPSLRAIIQMELTGMPMSAERVQQVKANLTAIQQEHLTKIVDSPLIKVLNLVIQTSEMEKANAKLKTKQHPLEKFSDVTFNPNSGPQLQRLLYEQMGLPVIDYTDTKQPATGADTI